MFSEIPARFPPLFHARKPGEVTGSCACILPRVPSVVSPWTGLSRALFSGQADLAETEVWKDGKTGWVWGNLVL